MSASVRKTRAMSDLKTGLRPLFKEASAAAPASTLVITSETSSERLKELGRFRVSSWNAQEAVLRADISASGEWMDQLDQSTAVHHLFAIHDEEIVGACRVSLHETLHSAPDAHQFLGEIAEDAPVASLNRMIIRPDFRGLGLAKMFDRLRILIASARGAKYILVQAVGSARSQALSRMGFRTSKINHVWDLFPGHSGPFYAMVADTAEHNHQKVSGEIKDLLQQKGDVMLKDVFHLKGKKYYLR